MTEKYYLVVEVSGDLAKIYDNISEDNIMDVNEAVDKLNELIQENQNLKAENKQLKQQIKDLRLGVIDSIHEAEEI